MDLCGKISGECGRKVRMETWDQTLILLLLFQTCWKSEGGIFWAFMDLSARSAGVAEMKPGAGALCGWFLARTAAVGVTRSEQLAQPQCGACRCPCGSRGDASPQQQVWGARFGCLCCSHQTSPGQQAGILWSKPEELQEDEA